MRRQLIALLSAALFTTTNCIVIPRRQLLDVAALLVGAGSVPQSSSAAADEQPSQSPKTFVITGASSGIGFATASELVRRGHRVCLACKSEESAAETARRLSSFAPSSSSIADAAIAVAWTPPGAAASCDLRSLEQVAAFADATSKLVPGGAIDGLLLIAGVDGAPAVAQAGAELESHFQTNYLGHALLLRRLLPKLRAAPSSRVVTVGSSAVLDATLDDRVFETDQAFLSLRRSGQGGLGSNPHVEYANSKALCVLLADELRRREPKLAVAACALPGRCATQIVRYELPQRAAQRLTMSDEQVARQARQLGLRTAAEGAALPLWLADSPDAAVASSSSSPSSPAPPALWLDPGVPARLEVPWRTEANGRALWDRTDALLDSLLT